MFMTQRSLTFTREIMKRFMEVWSLICLPETKNFRKEQKDKQKAKVRYLNHYKMRSSSLLRT